MKFILPILKTVSILKSQSLSKNDKRSIQKNAYRETCKDSKGRFNPNWHEEYRKNLKANQIKTRVKKLVISTIKSAI